LTERLVIQAFPEIDAALYKTQFKPSLRQSTEDVELGLVVPSFEVKEEAGMIVLEKSYEEEDFVQFDIELGGDRPSIAY
jgi:hypothetical protein